MQNPSPTLDLLNHNLHLHNILRRVLCVIKFEKHGYRLPEQGLDGVGCVCDQSYVSVSLRESLLLCIDTSSHLLQKAMLNQEETLCIFMGKFMRNKNLQKLSLF